MEDQVTNSSQITYNKHLPGKTNQYKLPSEHESLRKIQRQYQVRVESKERSRPVPSNAYKSEWTSFERAPNTNQGPRRRNLDKLATERDH